MVTSFIGAPLFCVIRAEKDRNHCNRCWSRVWSVATVDCHCHLLLVLLLLPRQEVYVHVAK